MNRRIRLLVVATLLPSQVLAQDIPQRIEEPERKQENAAQSRKAVEESKITTGLQGPAVTYEQVLEHPDDVELNYRYALSQIRQGNLRNAAATLERILMVDPDLPKVRLLYAIVLFRLDTLDDAERELNALKRQKMPQSLRDELNDYMSQIHQRRRLTHATFLLGAGIDFDDNRNAAPALRRRLFFGTPIPLDSNSTRQTDTAKTMLGSLDVSRDLGYQAGHQVYARYNYYRADQTKVKTLNLQNHYAEAGFVYKTPWADVTVDGEFDHLLLTQTTYMRSRGARLRLDRKLTPRLGAWGETAYTRQVYNRTLIVVTGDDRTGDKIEGTGGLQYVLTPKMSVLGSFTHTNQGALAKFDAYRRESAQVGHNWLLGHGRFLLSSFTFNFDQYQQPQPLVSNKNRRDESYRARSTFGLPLDIISRPLKDFLWTFTYEYYYTSSEEIPNFSYTDNKISTLLTYKWSM